MAAGILRARATTVGGSVQLAAPQEGPTPSSGSRTTWFSGVDVQPAAVGNATVIRIVCAAPATDCSVVVYGRSDAPARGGDRALRRPVDRRARDRGQGHVARRRPVQVAALPVPERVVPAEMPAAGRRGVGRSVGRGAGAEAAGDRVGERHGPGVPHAEDLGRRRARRHVAHGQRRARDGVRVVHLQVDRPRGERRAGDRHGVGPAGRGATEPSPSTMPSASTARPRPGALTPPSSPVDLPVRRRQQ